MKYPPPDEEGLSDPIEELFAAASLMLNSSGRGLRYQRNQDESIEEVRTALGLQARWGNWRNGKLPLGRQRRFTDILIDFFSGSFKHHHFTNPGNYGAPREIDYKKHGAAILEFLQEHRPKKLEPILEKLATYSLELAKIKQATGLSSHSARAVAQQATVESHKLSGPSLSTSDQSYVGTQKNLSNQQTQAILRILNTAHRSNGNAVAPSSLASLRYEVRPYSRSVATLREKRALYGEVLDTPLGLSQLDFAAMRLTFDRSQAGTLYSSITETPDRFSSHTIIAHPGQGKSITLAQVLLRLFETAGYWTFWSFDPARPFDCEHSSHCVEKYFALFRQARFVPRRIVFVFDDLQRRSTADRTAIHEFHSYCEYHSSIDAGISFLFSSTDPEDTMSPEQNTIRLRLDTDDEDKLYEILTEAQPIIVNKAYDTLEDLLADHPAKHHYKNDVQSLTDFIIQHSAPVRDFTPDWFSDTKNESPATQRTLAVVAVSQLLDLPLPEHIAHRMEIFDGEIPLESPGALIETSRRISRGGEENPDGWRGYVLSSPHYARSLLARRGKLEEPFISETIARMIEHSLVRAESDFRRWNVSDAEFVRHMFQRLAKRRFNRLEHFANGSRIAAKLFSDYGSRISHILRSQRAVMNCARWAGAFSYLFPDGTLGQFRPGDNVEERIVYDLCSYVLREVRVIESSQAFVPLMRAISTLCVKFKDEIRVRDLASAAEQAIDLNKVLKSGIAINDPEWERRANEVVLSYVRFLTAIPGRQRWEAYREVANTYQNVEQSFSTGFQFDARNWIERANTVWIRDNSDIEQSAAFLRKARATISNRVREQAKWKPLVDDCIVKFEKRHHRRIDDFPNEAKATLEPLSDGAK